MGHGRYLRDLGVDNVIPAPMGQSQVRVLDVRAIRKRLLDTEASQTDTTCTSRVTIMITTLTSGGCHIWR